MTFSPQQDLPAGYDSWKQSQPHQELIPEPNQNFIIEFGNDINTFTKESYKTFSSVKKEAERLFNRFGFARVLDESGVELERW